MVNVPTLASGGLLWLNLFLTLTASGSTPASDQKPADSHNRTEPTERSTVATNPFWDKRLTGYFKTRDGQELHYSVLLPPGPGPFPTLVQYSGYSPGSIGGAGYLAGHVNYPRDIEKQLI